MSEYNFRYGHLQWVGVGGDHFWGLFFLRLRGTAKIGFKFFFVRVCVFFCSRFTPKPWRCFVMPRHQSNLFGRLITSTIAPVARLAYHGQWKWVGASPPPRPVQLVSSLLGKSRSGGCLSRPSTVQRLYWWEALSCHLLLMTYSTIELEPFWQKKKRMTRILTPIIIGAIFFCFAVLFVFCIR